MARPQSIWLQRAVDVPFSPVVHQRDSVRREVCTSFNFTIIVIIVHDSTCLDPERFTDAVNDLVSKVKGGDSFAIIVDVTRHYPIIKDWGRITVDRVRSVSDHGQQVPKVLSMVSFTCTPEMLKTEIRSRCVAASTDGMVVFAEEAELNADGEGQLGSVVLYGNKASIWAGTEDWTKWDWLAKFLTAVPDESIPDYDE